MEKMELYNQYENLLKKIAWKFSKTTGMEFDDLLDEACLCFFEKVDRHNPKKGVLSTFLYTTITNHLINYTNKNCRKETSLDSMIEKVDEDCPFLESRRDTSKIPFMEFLDSLGQDAKTVCEIVLSSPEEFLVESSRKSRGNLKRVLLQKGWKRWTIIKAFREIKTKLNWEPN